MASKNEQRLEQTLVTQAAAADCSGKRGISIMVPTDSVSDASARHKSIDSNASKAYLVGGGIASMAAAAFLIRDGDFLGRNITIFEELGDIGGSLDGSGSAEKGYVLRGGRMLEKQVSLHL
jgi:myosin-crossreactive antigen